MADFESSVGRIEELRTMFEETQSRVSEIQDRIAAVEVDVTDDDEYIKVTVGSGGVTALTFDPRAMRLPSADLAERTLGLIQRGTSEVQQKVSTISQQLVEGIQLPDLPEEFQQP